MSGTIDIHAHILPGVDDGPPDESQALEMARVAAASGTSIVVATPHLRDDFPKVRVGELVDRCAALQSEISRLEIPLTVLPGAEVSVSWALRASDHDLRLASTAQRGTDLLIETPDDVTLLSSALSRITARGYRVVLAHPERSPEFQTRPELLNDLVAHGVMLALNAEVFLKPRSSRQRTLAELLCRKRLAHVLATDAHRAAEYRPISILGEGATAAAKCVGDAYARWMIGPAPRAIVEGEPLVSAPPIRRSRRWIPW